MTDTMTPEQRHRCMSHIRSRDTKPELKVRRWLWHHGYRYRIGVRSVPGKPDIVMRPYRTAIFVNGCFWHGHEGCKSFRLPQTNSDFWQTKIARNRSRDQRNYQLLRDNGWHVIVVWECQLAPAQLESTMRQVELQLNQNMLALYQHTPPTYHLQDNPLPIAAEEEPSFGTSTTDTP